MRILEFFIEPKVVLNFFLHILVVAFGKTFAFLGVWLAVRI